MKHYIELSLLVAQSREERLGVGLERQTEMIRHAKTKGTPRESLLKIRGI